MNLITVIPLIRSKVAEELVYFTSSDIPTGAIVTVPLRRKIIHAIVIDNKDAEKMKMDIKNAPFKIRKLAKIKASAFFPAIFIDACRFLAEHYATTIGAILDSLVADSILENPDKIAPPLPIQADLGIKEAHKQDSPKNDIDLGQIFAVQGDNDDRISSWRSLIRQEFAKKKSVAIYVPTIEDGENIFRELEKGIEGYIFKLNGNITKKAILTTWNSIAETEHPVVVIATGSFPLLPRGDIQTMIIEKENGRGWISPKTPCIDIRYALEVIAKKNKQVIFLADSLLRLETIDRLSKNEIDHGSPFKWRSISTAQDLLIDMRKNKVATIKKDEPTIYQKTKIDEQENNKPSTFHAISPELESLIRTNSRENTHLFILTIRRGVSPMTICDDCETIVTCDKCSAPVVLHTSRETNRNFFMCHKCGERFGADRNCLLCGGWRLVTLGIGIERVNKDIREKFPETDIFQIDSDTTKNYKQIIGTINKFKAKPGSILLGTEMALLYLNDKVDYSAIVSLDSLFALPDFRIGEKVMYMLVRLRSQTTRSFIVQTRRPEEKVFEFGLKGNISDFYRLAHEERKRFGYPPFSRLIKMTLEGKKDAIAKEMATIQKLVEPYEIDIFPAFTSTLRGNSVIHGLIKIEPGRWPDVELVKKIRSLPQKVSIKVDPESLL
jgi:primosomal protein N'